ncbi:MAG: hypothetical protein OXQ29_11270, partial [Rhodospirillaceae bacterium]|nr:hypothetical protein [Rhodospirillaceae bacterium]
PAPLTRHCPDNNPLYKGLPGVALSDIRPALHNRHDAPRARRRGRDGDRRVLELRTGGSASSQRDAASGGLVPQSFRR